ncbi:MAG: GAF domain-containing protein [Candidatus Hydrogenedentes bacterium]|nr:GAF domain-containing protein [Candidatus Hydrogenedentota bacterium]
MATYTLVIRQGDSESSVVVEPGRALTIGRALDADIVLPGQEVSRRHARVRAGDDGLIVEDLGSRNGVQIDGETVETACLAGGGVFMIADCAFEVREGAETSTASTRIPYEEASALYESMVAEGPAGRLPILYRAAQLLGSVFDLEDLLAQILELIFDAMPAHRGFVLLLSPETGRPEVHATRSRDSESQSPPLSRAVIDHVLSEREALLTTDAQLDERFAASESVALHAIHAAMCVPLCGRNEAVGTIYVDSGPDARTFDNGDLELLTAIGRVVGVAVENARLYQETLRQERLAAIGLAMAGVSHSVKNILTGVRGGEEFVDTALAAHDWEPLEKGWRVLRRCIERIETLMLNLLTLSKDRPPQRMPTDLGGVVSEAVATVAPYAERLGVAIDVQAEETPPAHVDAPAIYRVVLNLALNAVEACSDAHAPVHVACRADATGHFINVRDEGPGIAPELQPKLFELFQSTKGAGGTGLGLPSSRKIVREHGGDITVDSAPGKGAAFTVFLPVQS